MPLRFIAPWITAYGFPPDTPKAGAGRPDPRMARARDRHRAQRPGLRRAVARRQPPRGRGRGSSIIKPFSQLTVVVRQVEQEKAEKKSAKKPDQGAAKKPAAKTAAKSKGTK